MGILDGLEKYGVDNLDDSALFQNERPSSKNDKNGQGAAEKKVSEMDFLFDKSYTCPVCDTKFTAKTVRTGKIATLGADMDLRPRYENIDVNKYDTVVCPICGYAALTKHVGGLTTRQIHAIRDKISVNYAKPVINPDEPYTYDEAIERLKLVLANAIVKQGKASEKAMILLKIAWLYRGYTESLDMTVASNQVLKKVNEGLERQFLQKVVEGFDVAKSSENYPIAGMDESTLDYMLAAINILLENFKDAEWLLSHLITSRTANSRIKSRARDLRDTMRERQALKQDEEDDDEDDD